MGASCATVLDGDAEAPVEEGLFAEEVGETLEAEVAIRGFLR